MNKKEIAKENNRIKNKITYLNKEIKELKKEMEHNKKYSYIINKPYQTLDPKTGDTTPYEVGYKEQIDVYSDNLREIIFTDSGVVIRTCYYGSCKEDEYKYGSKITYSEYKKWNEWDIEVKYFIKRINND